MTDKWMRETCETVENPSLESLVVFYKQRAERAESALTSLRSRVARVAGEMRALDAHNNYPSQRMVSDWLTTLEGDK